MKVISLFFLLILSSQLFISCSEQTKPVETYENEINQFFEKKTEELKAPRGYLRVNGLFWLEDSKTYTWGSGKSADFIFPDATLPEITGSITRNGNQITLKVTGSIRVFLNDLIFTHGGIYGNDHDLGFVRAGNSEFFVIRRGNLFGIRLFQIKNKEIDAFAGAERFEINPDYKVEARLIQTATSDSIQVLNVLGQVGTYPSPGLLKFSLLGETYQLQPQFDGEQYFLVFGDLSNKKDTYQGGRFLYIDKVDSKGLTTIDFNKAENPPCAYNEFTTCPLPPAQNKLPIRIEAGEKRWKK
jgi:uncharacterized protein (DUF1684 family)